MEASIDKVFIVGSYSGELLVINLTLKNNADYNLSPYAAQMSATATLDGKPLAMGYLPDSNPHALPSSANIAPGAEGPGQLAFELPAKEGIVELLINSDTLSYTDVIEILNETIDLATVEAEVSESDYEVAVKDVTVTDDGEGGDLIVMTISFTNNSSEATSFGSAVNLELFQNDMSLKRGYLPWRHPLDDDDLSSNSYVDIREGASIDVQVVYELYDTTSPVEIKAVDSWSFDKAVILDKKIDVSGS